MYVLNIIFALSLLIVCNAGYVDKINKCSVSDDKCFNDLFQNLLNEVTKTGLPELGLPKLDPTKVQNLTAVVMDDVALFMPEATVKGVKNCVFEYNNIDFKNKVAKQKLVCDLSIKGAFTLSGKSPLIQGLLGIKDVKGNGTAKVKLEKVRFTFNLPFALMKTGNNVFVQIMKDKVTYDYEVQGVSFSAEKLFIGKNDLTKLVVSYLNENWRNIIVKSGRSVTDKAVEFYLGFIDKFFTAVPINKLIVEDAASLL